MSAAMYDPVTKRSPLPSLEEAVRVIETRPFASAAVIAVVTDKSLLTVYAALRDGSIPSTRVGNKHCIPCAPYRNLMAAKLPSAPAPAEQVAA